MRESVWRPPHPALSLEAGERDEKGFRAGLRWPRAGTPRALVAPQGDERGMSEPAVVGPVAEPDLADEPGPHPVMALALRDRAGVEGRRGPRERLELFPEALEPRLIEAGAHLGDVDEARAVVDADVQRAEVAARALGIRVAADDELLATLEIGRA